jgi:hypothetical protein
MPRVGDIDATWAWKGSQQESTIGHATAPQFRTTRHLAGTMITLASPLDRDGVVGDRPAT